MVLAVRPSFAYAKLVAGLSICAYCKQHRLRNVQWVAETISGTKKPAKRKLGSLLDGVEAGDTIICTELSRLGRSLIMILNVLQELLERRRTAQTGFKPYTGFAVRPSFTFVKLVVSFVGNIKKAANSAIIFSQKCLPLHSDFRLKLNALCCRKGQSKGLNAPAKRESKSDGLKGNARSVINFQAKRHL